MMSRPRSRRSRGRNSTHDDDVPANYSINPGKESWPGHGAFRGARAAGAGVRAYYGVPSLIDMLVTRPDGAFKKAPNRHPPEAVNRAVINNASKTKESAVWRVSDSRCIKRPGLRPAPAVHALSAPRVPTFNRIAGPGNGNVALHYTSWQ